MEREYKVKSLAKALDILECFDEQHPELGIVQICSMLDLNKSNVHNIITTFQQKGYIEKNDKTGKYHLGMNLLRFSFIINNQLNYQRLVYDLLADAAQEMNAVVYFAIPHNGKAFYLCNSYPGGKNYDFPFRTITGEVAPFYCTAIGKAMLAFMNEEEAEKYICAPMPRFTDMTITDAVQLRNELAKIREQGYSFDNCEHEYGVKCIGAPILNQHGEVLGAVSVSGSDAYMTEDVIKKAIRIMKETAFHIRERF